MVVEARRCVAVRKDGSPCRALALPTSPDDHCWAHDAANQAKVRQVRKAGGHGRASRARAEKLMPAKLRPVLDTLLDALGKVEDGSLTPQQASSMAAVAGAVLKVFQVGTLEERLAALEAVQLDGPVMRRA